MYDVRDADGGATLRVRVSPRASRNALARLLARVLHVPASAVEVRHGASGRDKLLHVTGLDAEALRARLASGGGAVR